MKAEGRINYRLIEIVAGRAGFWGALASWVWGRQLQPQVCLWPSVSNRLTHIRLLLYFNPNLLT